MTHAALKDLLPCPFCGEAAIVREPGSDDGFAIHIHCRCGVTMLGKRNHFSTAAEAITAWNRRTALSAMEGEAAVEILGWKDNASPRLRFLTKVDRLTAGTILYTAPPAHQPGEVITDEMVARGAAALANEFHDYYYWEDMDAYEREPWLTQSRMVLTAALSTTTASGGEHG